MFLAGSHHGVPHTATSHSQHAPQPPHKSKIDHLYDFNRGINILSTNLVKTFPNDAYVSRVQRRIALATNEAPEIVIGEVGPILYKYQEQIYKGEVEFFMQSEYEEEYRNSVDQEKVDMARYIIPKIKQAVQTLSPEESKKYQDQAVKLLDSYIEWVTYGE